MVDSSGNGNDGTATSNVTLVTGVSGQAYNFNPATGESYVTVPDSDSLDPGTQDISFSSWVNFQAIPDTDYNVVRKGLGRAAGGYYKMEIKSRLVNDVKVAKARCQFKDGTKTTSSLMAKPTLSLNTWYKLTCTKTASSIQIKVEGGGVNRTQTKSISLGSISNGSTLTIARNEDGDDQYGGFIDETTVTIGG
ncbi:MAG: LamG-like jellyroll fold domain-containing protein [Actinomycetota bacterium]